VEKAEAQPAPPSSTRDNLPRVQPSSKNILAQFKSLTADFEFTIVTNSIENGDSGFSTIAMAGNYSVCDG
jgi:hypothetical protein